MKSVGLAIFVNSKHIES